ncbi:Uncharacterised protein [Mycobacteroides abscessus subsp. abscessus]|nr:Uncharacterised protein [Mycobacteroides abscessus subsp. abscessus]
MVVGLAAHHKHFLAIWGHSAPIDDADQAAVAGVIVLGVDLQDSARVDNVFDQLARRGQTIGRRLLLGARSCTGRRCRNWAMRNRSGVGRRIEFDANRVPSLGPMTMGIRVIGEVVLACGQDRRAPLAATLGYRHQATGSKRIGRRLEGEISPPIRATVVYPAENLDLASVERSVEFHAAIGSRSQAYRSAATSMEPARGTGTRPVCPVPGYSRAQP